MRPSARLVNVLPSAMAATVLPTLLFLGGCSGLGHFLGDTAELPGYNPNSVTGVSENLQRARGRAPVTEAMLPQAGNVWPGPPQPLPTLGDVSRGTPGQQNVLGGGATMPRGGSMSMGEQNAVQGGAPLGGGFSGAGLSNPIPDPAARFTKPSAPGKQAPAASGGGSGAGSSGGNIVIPNGDGTSTVISPDGSVKTVPGTPK